MLKRLPDLHWTTAFWRSQVCKASALVVYVTATCKWTSSPTELKVHTAYADLKELRPVSGVVRGQAAPVVQPSKPSAPLVLPNKSAVNTESEGPPQPLQQVQQSAPVEYEKNSLAIKLSNNPLSSLAGLQEAAETVLDEPVSLTAFVHQQFSKHCYLYSYYCGNHTFGIVLTLPRSSTTLKCCAIPEPHSAWCSG